MNQNKQFIERIGWGDLAQLYDDFNELTKERLMKKVLE